MIYISVHRQRVEDRSSDNVFVIQLEDGERITASHIRITGACELVYSPTDSPALGATAYLRVEDSTQVEIINPKQEKRKNER